MRVTDPGDQIGLHGARACTLSWEQVPVPSSLMLGPRGQGPRVATEALAEGRILVSAACLGVCKRIVDLMVERAGTRRSFGRSVGELGMVRDRIASALALTYALESVVYTTAAAPATTVQRDLAVDSLACKVLAADTLLRLATLSFPLASGDGYRTSSDFGGVYQDAMGYLSIGGPVDVLRSSLGISLVEGIRSTQKPQARSLDLLARAESLASNVLRRALPTASDDDFAHEEAQLRDVAGLFSSAIAETASRYGRDIVEVQFVQRRIARSAVSLYGALCALARARTAAKQHGKQGSLRERDLARIYLRGAITEVRAELSSLADNDDELRKSVAVKAYNDKGYALDVV